MTTFDAECTHFWGKRRKFGLGWSLFLANRYLPLVAYMIEAPWWAFNQDPACASIEMHGNLRSRVRPSVLAALLTYLHLEIRPVDSGCFLDDRRLPFGLYQIAIALLNIAPLVVDLLEIVRPGGEVSDYSNSLLSFITPLISILLTQFYFDLQETADLPVWEGADAHAAHPEWTSPSPSPDQSSTGTQTDLRFATYVSQDRSRDHSESSTSSGARRRSVLSIEGSQTSD
ncbi:hypothetical protein VTO73DRAFT_13875 [Trametes versicolor]